MAAVAATCGCAILTRIISTILGRGVECAGIPLVRQIQYYWNSKKNVETLDINVIDLKDKRKMIQISIDAAEMNFHEIREAVEDWPRRVNEEAERDNLMRGLLDENKSAKEMLNHQDYKGFSGCQTRYKVGRQAKKRIDIIAKFVEEIKSFGLENVTLPFHVDLTKLPSTASILAFPSRISVIKGIMVALTEERNSLVGIHGMPGVGKTILMDQVRDRVIQESLFDAVVSITVSQTIDLKCIQDTIAKIVGFTEFENVVGPLSLKDRASVLLVRLKLDGSKKTLVILDDVWCTDRDLLAEIGIPRHYEGCKTLISSRSIQVCNSLKTDVNIQVHPLPDNESWDLFKENVGDVIDFSDDIRQEAHKIVNECGGLPLALDILGKLLRYVTNIVVWENTTDQLEKSDLSETPIVIKSIMLSYNNLSTDILKGCFLLCCLFPEDYRISVTDLTNYVMGDVIIRGDLETLKSIKTRVDATLYKLVASGLLICITGMNNDPISVKMHDVVRDVAISLASEGNKFYIKAGLERWPKIGSSVYNNCVRLSLIGSNITKLPYQPKFPCLLSLSLRSNELLKEIPDNFFKSMGTLLSLDISHTGIASLPSSLTFLVKLCSLDIGFCNLEKQTDLSILGKLKSLI